MKKILSITSLLCLLAQVSWADSTEENINKFNPVHTALYSQTVAADARSAGMGEVGAATDPDVASQFWNPAKYPFCISKAGVQLSYTPWLRQLVSDMNIAHLTGYYRIGDYSAVSASLKYFALGSIYEEADESGNYNESTVQRPYEMSFDVGYSLMLSEKFSLGTAVRLLVSDMSYTQKDEKKTASAFAADIAGYYQNYVNIGERECQLGLGFNISNIGSKITFGGSNRSEFIPTNMRLGASLMIPINEYNRFAISADANKLLVPTYPTKDQYKDYCKTELGKSDSDFNTSGEIPDYPYQTYLDDKYFNIGSIEGIFKSFSDAPGGLKEELQEIQWSVGAEYTYNDRFSIRAGYHDEAENKGNRKYFTVGAGFRLSAFTLDAAYCIATSNSNPLDKTLRFSLNFDLDGLQELFGKR